MKEYSRRVTGIVSNFGGHSVYIDSKSVGDIVAEMLKKGSNFAGTISIVITDLTEDSGTSTEYPEVTEEVMKTVSDVVCKISHAVTGALFEGDANG